MTQYHNHCSEDVVRKGNEGIKSSDNIFYKNISSYFTFISALFEIDFFLLKKKQIYIFHFYFSLFYTIIYLFLLFTSGVSSGICKKADGLFVYQTGTQLVG